MISRLLILVVACAIGCSSPPAPPPPPPGLPSIRDYPDVVIEKEAFRRFSLLSADTCTYCRESWRSCECEMGKDPLMFQNREKQTVEFIETELARYGVKE